MHGYLRKALVLSLLILALIGGAVWILSHGSRIAEGSNQNGGMAPAIKQRSTVRIEQPYEVVNTSWGEVEEHSALAESEQKSSPPELNGVEVAYSRK